MLVRPSFAKKSRAARLRCRDRLVSDPWISLTRDRHMAGSLQSEQGHLLGNGSARAATGSFGDIAQNLPLCCHQVYGVREVPHRTRIHLGSLHRVKDLMPGDGRYSFSCRRLNKKRVEDDL